MLERLCDRNLRLKLIPDIKWWTDKTEMWKYFRYLVLKMDWFEPKDKNCVAVGSGNSAGLFRLISMLDVSFSSNTTFNLRQCTNSRICWLWLKWFRICVNQSIVYDFNDLSVPVSKCCYLLYNKNDTVWTPKVYKIFDQFLLCLEMFFAQSIARIGRPSPCNPKLVHVKEICIY